jgi:uncharacterized protein
VAPEFIPIIICGMLILAALGGCLAMGVLPVWKRLRERTGPLLIVVLVPTLGLILAAAVCAKGVHQAFVLNEPMAIAACQGDVSEVRAFLERGASPNACDVDCGSPALVCAAAGGHAEIVGLLLKQGADPSARDSQGVTALERARQARHEAVVQLLEGAARK